MNILLGVDGSESALRATRHVIETIGLYRESAHVELVTVHLPVPKVGGLSNVVINQGMVEKYYKDEGEAALAGARERLDAAGIPYTPRILVGDIAETLVEHCNATHCREMCIGTRGMTALANLVLGSVATRVVHLATVPIVLVK
jgi:nucleotide-binding universal stress UspA family protein